MKSMEFKPEILVLEALAHKSQCMHRFDIGGPICEVHFYSPEKNQGLFNIL